MIRKDQSWAWPPADSQKNLPKFAVVFTTEYKLRKPWSSRQLRDLGTTCQAVSDSGSTTGKVVPDRSPFQGWRWAQNRRGAVHLSLWALPCVKGLLLEQCKASLLCRLRSAKVQSSGLKGRVGAAWRFAVGAGAGNCIPWCGSSLVAGRSSVLCVWRSYPLTECCWRAYIGAFHFLGTPHANLIEDTELSDVPIHFIWCCISMLTNCRFSYLQHIVTNIYRGNKWSHLQ